MKALKWMVPKCSIAAHIYLNEVKGMPNVPVIPDYEVAGVIEQVGELVT